ncbi:MAG: metallophosphoesterase family protein, partial [Isosphaeraceae bacterium]
MTYRTIAIGDIHGCSLALERLIAAVNPGPEDTVVPLGDYIDRGPESRGVLDQLLALGERCRLVPLLGNHEQMLLDARTSATMKRQWLEYGGIATLQSYGDTLDLDAVPPEHIAFLETCRDYYETETHIFVHASYCPNLRMDEQPSFV